MKTKKIEKIELKRLAEKWELREVIPEVAAINTLMGKINEIIDKLNNEGV